MRQYPPYRLPCPPNLARKRMRRSAVQLLYLFGLEGRTLQNVCHQQWPQFRRVTKSSSWPTEKETAHGESLNKWVRAWSSSRPGADRVERAISALKHQKPTFCFLSTRM